MGSPLSISFVSIWVCHDRVFPYLIPLATIAAIILDAGAAWLCGLSFHLRGGSEPFGPVLYLIPIAAPTFAILAVILLFVVFPKE